jgi:uncharacterized protein YecE (DUF72 family)
MDLPGLQEGPVPDDREAAQAQTHRRLKSRYPQLRIGTSGYSFDDWVGPFYPSGTSKGKMFDFYLRHFDTVEINSTYYRIPHPRVMRNIDSKTPDGFEFVVKTHGSFTHERDKFDENLPAFLESVAPMAESGKLSGLLAQFPFSFRYSPQNLDYVLENGARFSPHPLFVEYRHDSWMRPEVKDAMQKAGIGYCNVDEPALPHLVPPEAAATTPTGYIRLHGRNAEKWWGGGGERYNYSYTDEQLREWVKRLDDLRAKTTKAFVFFNNCHLGRAVKDAQRFMNLLVDEE